MVKARFVIGAVFVALIAAATSSVRSQSTSEDFGKFDPGQVPEPKPASDAGERAIAKMRPAPGLKVELWAAEPLLANPVALNFDDKGRCFLVETWRFEHGVIDMRNHMDWLD